MDFPTVGDVKNKYSTIKGDCERVENQIDHLKDQVARDQEKLIRTERRNDREGVRKANHRLQRRKRDLRRAKTALNHLRGWRDALERRIETASQELRDSELTIAHLSPVEKRRLVEKLREEDLGGDEQGS